MHPERNSMSDDNVVDLFPCPIDPPCDTEPREDVIIKTIDQVRDDAHRHATDVNPNEATSSMSFPHVGFHWFGKDAYFRVQIDGKKHIDVPLDGVDVVRQMTKMVEYVNSRV